MDIAAKKLAFIEEYLHLRNEKIIDRLEKTLRAEKENDYRSKPNPLSQAEMDTMIEESEEDIRQGKVLTHESLKQEVLSWRSSRKK